VTAKQVHASVNHLAVLSATFQLSPLWQRSPCRTLGSTEPSHSGRDARPSFLLVLLVVLLLCLHPSTFPPCDADAGQRVELKVNKLWSPKTQLTYDYYSLPVCKPDAIERERENIGQVLVGDRIMNSNYLLELGKVRSAAAAEAGSTCCRLRLSAAGRLGGGPRAWLARGSSCRSSASLLVAGGGTAPDSGSCYWMRPRTLPCHRPRIVPAAAALLLLGLCRTRAATSCAPRRTGKRSWTSSWSASSRSTP
jgi:hypothetical protein